MKSNEKVVLLTGASTGMGFEMMTRLAEEGYLLCVLSRSPELLCSDLLGGRWQDRIDVFGVDLKERESVDKAVGEIWELYGRIDIVINNAGYGLVATLEEAEEAEMLEQFDINLFGLVRVTRAVLPAMRHRRSGVIINISSFLGRVGLPLLSFYNASKYAVEGITDSLRLELASFGIRVHSVMPGFFSTQFARSNLQINAGIESEDSPYRNLSRCLAPKVLRQINEGDDPRLVAEAILKILKDPDAPVRIPVGETARRFLTMRRELSDKEYERRVMEFYGIEPE